ncbi:hypothetical protein TRVA0_041S01112 [Trichomonascus vanleenenianus]|uniref:uncharacterized protein n=1 Tax=Trichomonascus vanleenenianus TaxID=2268995 RepID=UPI003ECAC8FD
MGFDHLEYEPKWFPLELPHEINLQSHTPPDLKEARARFRYKMRHLKPPAPNSGADPMASLDNVLADPQLPGQEGDKEIKIKLREEFRPVKEGRQRLFLAEITDPCGSHLEEGMQFVAELFDPLALFDVHASAFSDLDYSCTVIAYTLLKDLQGTLIPKYYGSYTMKVPVVDRPEHRYRDVRVILRQYIEGKGLNKIEPESFNREKKQHLMERIVSAEQEFDDRGVGIRRGYFPNSVILVDKDCMQVVVWRFIGAIFGPDLDQPMVHESRFAPGKLASRLLKWSELKLRVSGFDIFVDWDWISWMKEKYGTEEDMGLVAQQVCSHSTSSGSNSFPSIAKVEEFETINERNRKRRIEELQTAQKELKKRSKKPQ